MQKIKNSILDRMMTSKLTSKEIDFLIYISRFQNDDGRVSGIHYKEVCNQMKMSYQRFYDVKNSLIKKGFISAEKSNRIDHDITILGNKYENVENITEGYVNTNHNMFYHEAFFKLKAGAKILAMELLRMSYAGKGEFHIGTTNFYVKYTRLFGVTKRVMRTYLMSLKEVFFSIGIVDGQYYIRPKKIVYKQHGAKSENDNLAEHNVDVICRRNKIKDYTDKAYKDVLTIVRQYKREVENIGKDIYELLKVAVEKSLEKLNIRTLKPKLIHMMLKEEMAY